MTVRRSDQLLRRRRSTTSTFRVACNVTRRRADDHSSMRATSTPFDASSLSRASSLFIVTAQISVWHK
jgi:hypothetical protein